MKHSPNCTIGGNKHTVKSLSCFFFFYVYTCENVQWDWCKHLNLYILDLYAIKYCLGKHKVFQRINNMLSGIFILYLHSCPVLQQISISTQLLWYKCNEKKAFSTKYSRLTYTFSHIQWNKCVKKTSNFYYMVPFINLLLTILLPTLFFLQKHFLVYREILIWD